MPPEPNTARQGSGSARDADGDAPDAARILDLLNGFRRSKVIFAAVQLGVFDGERPAAAAVERLLDACVALGFLRKSGRDYVNAPIADAYLRRRCPLAAYVRYSNRASYRLWAHLEEAVVSETPAWRQAFGSGAGVGQFMREGSNRQDFVLGMHGTGALSAPAVVGAFDLSAFRRLVDLGGATGHLARAALARYPHMEAVLIDRPEVLELAADYVDSRVRTVAADFMTDSLPDGDLYVLGRILHGESDDGAVAILQRVFAQLPPGGGVLLAESLLPEDPAMGADAHLQSLHMLVVNGGRERTLDEYRRLLEAVGFVEVRGQVTGTLLDAILARKEA